MNLDSFVSEYMTKNGKLVPARLQAALALLERVRTNPSFQLADHLAARGSSGLKGHETFGAQAHDRWGLIPLNRNHGRRSSNLAEWGDTLLSHVRNTVESNPSQLAIPTAIDDAQLRFVTCLREIIEQDPIIVRVRGRSADFVIADVLRQAEEKGRLGDVAQYLTGAKLTLRFQRHIDPVPANKSDRKSRLDPDARLGDFQIGSTTIEVAMGVPDEKHLQQIADALEDSDCEFWLLTKADRVGMWVQELDSYRNRKREHAARVVVRSVEAFVGQNVAELGEFDGTLRATQLERLFEIYNTQWVDLVGFPGIRVVVKR